MRADEADRVRRDDDRRPPDQSVAERPDSCEPDAGDAKVVGHLTSPVRPYTSTVVLYEASRGDPEAAAERVAALAGLPLVPILETVEPLTEQLLARSALPRKARVDAIHLAVAATNAVQYLLTWNCRHLANATLRARINEVCRELGYEPPIICTPAELGEVKP